MESDGLVFIDYSNYEHWKYEKFASFVNNMLLRRDIYLHTFKLHFKHYHPVNFKDVRTWIGYAVKHNVKVLDVNVDRYNKTVLPRCIFTCPSLQELNLNMGEAPEDDLEHQGHLLPDMINLPSLKRLTLYDVEVGDICLMRVIAQSPVLEDVHLINCAQYLEHIDSKVLKRLTIDGCIDDDKGLTIAAPQLIHFQCIGWPLEDISWQEHPSLKSAHIDTCCSGDTFDGLSDFTRIILHAKRLALCGSDIKLKKGTKGEETSSMPTTGMTFECTLLETVIIQCSKDDDEIEKTVNAMVGYGISLEKMQVIFYEDIERAERWGMSLEEMKEHDILEEARKENPESEDDSNAGSYNSDDDNNEMEDEYDEDVEEEEDSDNDDEMDDDDDF